MNRVVNPAATLPHCDVWLKGKRVARLFREGDFKHLLIYESDTKPEDFVSLTMPVKKPTWEWQELHPFFRINLPEGHQLGMLKEAFGPSLDGTDLTLLGLVGANGIGRVKVVPANQQPNVLPEHFNLQDVLKGDNSEQRFQELLHQHLRSGVSGVMPKFLSPLVDTSDQDGFLKGALVTSRAIVKGSSQTLPYLALNEHLSMAVVRQAGWHAAETAVSDDGMALVVSRFDTNDQGEPILGFEDMCSLLGMRPAEKYDTTWERIARTVREYVPPAGRAQQQEQLMRQILSTYVLRNADCHAKNVALVYDNLDNVRLSPIYDVVTTVAYDGYRSSPPGLSLAGRKTWQPGKTLQQFAQGVCGLSTSNYKLLVDQICQAAVDVTPQVLEAMQTYPEFHEIGKRMLLAWEEGIQEVSSSARANGAPLKHMQDHLQSAKLSAPKSEPKIQRKTGQSELLGKR